MPKQQAPYRGAWFYVQMDPNGSVEVFTEPTEKGYPKPWRWETPHADEVGQRLIDYVGVLGKKTVQPMKQG